MSNSETKSFKATAEEIDQLIRQGLTQKAVQILSSIGISEIPRSYRLNFAKLFRRLGMNTKGLRTLTSIVRPSSSLNQPASPQELCEYGVLLSRVGSLTEAKEMLQAVDSDLSAESLLYLSFCHISEWNYKEALPLLRAYENKTHDDYQKLISKVNQVACLIALEKYQEAEQLVEESLTATGSVGANRLQANLYELRGQIYIGQERFSESIGELKRAQVLLGAGKTYDETFIAKWLAFIDASQSGSIAPLEEIREKANKAKHWEVVRDIDFMILKIKFDQDRFYRLVAGSRSPFYKDKVIKKMGQVCPASFQFGDTNSGEELDLHSGEWCGKMIFKQEAKALALLRALASDFYFPMSSGAIHSSLYADEYYNVDSTPLKIRQQIFRLRKLLESEAIPLKILNEGESYNLKIDSGVSLKVSSFNQYLGALETELELLRKDLGSSFKAQEACQVLGLSRSHFLRKAEAWLEEGLVEKQGRGRSTAYRLRKVS